MILTLASIWRHTSAMLAGSRANRRAALPVVALVALAALVHQLELLKLLLQGDSANVHLGAWATEGGWFPTPRSRLLLVRLVLHHFCGHCVPAEYVV